MFWTLGGLHWEYSQLARIGNSFWQKAIDPVLRAFAGGDLTFLRKLRGVIQIILMTAILLIPLSLFFIPGHLLTASGLLFDIAGALRLFLLEELATALEGFKENKQGNLPSVAMRELIMPEASGPYDADAPYMSQFYYSKRGVLFLFVGFSLQMVGDFCGN